MSDAAGTAGVAGVARPDTAAAPLSRRAVRHTAWNLAGVLLPFAVGIVAIPVLTRALGPARFGMLGLAWTILEYFSLFDAGLGRATVRAVAGRRSELAVPGRAASESPGARELSATVTAAIMLQVALGGAAALCFALSAPALVGGLLRVPAELRPEAVGAIWVLAATVPVLMLNVALRGLLEAAERFDISNAVRMPVSVGTFLLPAAIAAAGGGLPQMLLALLVLRVAGVAAQLVGVRRALPAFRWRWPREGRSLRELLAFGGWVAVSNVVSPTLTYLDRLFVGGLLGVVALGYYVAPFEAALRLLVVPAALVGTLYPMASALIAAGDADGTRRLYAGAVRALALSLSGAAVFGFVLAPELLGAWLGPEYAARSTTVLRLLVVGVLVNAVTHVPFAFLQAAGRPGLMARFHLAELVLHVPIALWMVSRYGLPGAALAWTVRALLDAVLVFGAAGRVLGVRAGQLADGRAARACALAALLASALYALRVGAGALGMATILVGAVTLTGLHALAAWRWLVSREERAALRLSFRGRRPEPEPASAPSSAAAAPLPTVVTSIAAAPPASTAR